MTIDADELAEIHDLIGLPPPAATDQMVTTTDLARWLGMTANRVNTLARDGVFARAASGHFPLQSSIRAYVDHLRRSSSSRGSADPAYVAAKTRAAEATAEKLETANRLARAELLPAGDVEREWASVLRTIRAAMLALPSRMAQRLGHLSAHDLAALDAEVRVALEELTDDQ